MAGNVLADLVVRVTGDITPVVAAFGKLRTEMTALQTIGAGFTAVGAAMTAGITLPIMAIGAAAVQSAVTVGGAYKDIQAQTGTTGAELEKLKRGFDTVFSHVPQSAKEVAQVISIVYDKLNELNYAIPETSKKFLDLARMSQEAPQKLAENVSSMLLQWKVPASEAAKTLDLLYTAYTKTHVPITTLTNDVDKQGQVMRQAYGFTLPETIALFSSLNEVGISTSDIMRGMDYGWSNLTKAMTGSAGASKQMAPVVAAINTELTKMKGSAKDSGDVMAAFFQGIKDGSITAGDAALVFGNRFSAQIIGAIREGRLDFKDFLSMLNEAPVSLDAAADATKYFFQKLEELKHGFEVALAPLGIAVIGVLTGFMPVIQQIIGGITRLVSAFTSLPQPIQNAFIIIAGLAAIVGPLLIVIGLLISSFATIAMGALAFAGAMITLAPAIIAIGLVLAPIVIALAALAAGFALAYTQSATFRGILGTLAGDLMAFGGHVAAAFGFFTKGEWKQGLAELKKGFDDLFNDLKKIDWHSVGKTIIEEIQKGVKDLMNTWGPIWDEIKTSFTNWVKSVNWQQLSHDIPNGIINGIKELQSLLGPVWDGIVTSFKTWMGSVPWGQLAQDIPNAIINAIKLGMATIGPVWDFIVTSFNNWKASVNWAQLAADIPLKIQQGIQTAQGIVGPVWDFIKTSLINWIHSVTWDDVGNQIGLAIRNAIKTALNTLVGGLGELIPTGGTTGGSSLFQTGLNAATSFLSGFQNGLGDLWQLVMDGLEPLAGKIADYMENNVNWTAIGTFIGNILGTMITSGINALFGTGSGTDTDKGGAPPDQNSPIFAAGGVGTTGASPYGTKTSGWTKLSQAGEDAGDALVTGFVKGVQDAMANIKWSEVIKNAILGTGKNIEKEGEPIGNQVPDLSSASSLKGGIFDPNGEPWASINRLFGGPTKENQGYGSQWGTGQNKGVANQAVISIASKFVPVAGAVWDFISKGTANLAVEVVQKGGEFINTLKNLTSRFLVFTVNIVKKGGEWLANFTGKVVDFTVNILKKGGEWISNFTGKVVDFTVNILKKGGEWISNFTGKVVDFTVNIIKQGGEWLDTLKTTVINIAVAIGSFVTTVADSWLNTIHNVASGIASWATSVADTWLNTIHNTATAIGSWATGVADTWLNAVHNTATAIASFATGVADSWLNAVHNTATAIASFATGVADSWLNAIHSTSAQIWSFATGVADAWLNALHSINIQGIWQGILGGLPSLTIDIFGVLKLAGGALIGWGKAVANKLGWRTEPTPPTPVDPMKYRSPAAESAGATGAHASGILALADGLRSLATGAYGEEAPAYMTSKPQLAVIGEAGPEAVIPQKYWWAIQPWVLQALPKLGGGASIGAGATGVASSIEINVTGNTILDDRAARKLAKTIADTIKHERGII
jgi:phage-related protein